jgi:hypothetical protein
MDYAKLAQLPVSPNPANALTRRILANQGSKVVSKYGTKTAGKILARTAAHPGFFIADGLELGTEYVCRKAGCSEDDARFYGGSVGLGASVGTGVLVAGPVGAALGLGLWGVGKLFGSLWD